MGVVKIVDRNHTRQIAQRATDGGEDRRTRDRIIEALLRAGALTAPAIAAQLALTTTGIRRHLDALVAEGIATEESVESGRRGRPARRFGLTAAGRDQLPHTYDDLAVSALRHIAQFGGRTAVRAFADEQVAELEQRCTEAINGAGEDPLAKATALAEALSQEGYAASAQVLASGGQLCQRHCPVAHAAAEFPELCEAETELISRLLGSHVQRLATIARGDGVCTTHVPSAPQLRAAAAVSSTATSGTTNSTTIISTTTISTATATATSTKTPTSIKPSHTAVSKG